MSKKGRKEDSPFDVVAQPFNVEHYITLTAEVLHPEHSLDLPEDLKDADIGAVQRSLKLRLPAAYIQMMRVKNGGCLKGCTWVDGNTELPQVSGIGGDGQSDCITQQYDNAHNEWGVPEWLIPLGGDGHGWVCFDYRDEERRKTGENVPVVSCSQFSEPEFNPVPLAADFDEFCEFLKNLKEPE